MRQLSKDVTLDLLGIACEVLVFAVKAALVYSLIKLFTDMHHENAMEVALLISGVDFLTNQRAKQFHTVSDFKERISMSNGKIIKTITKHKETG